MTFQPFKPNKPDSRYIKPKICRELPDRMLKYKNAQELAKVLNFNDAKRYYVVVDGTFIFGDLIEAWCTNFNVHVKRLSISTLSLSQDNIYSLENLLLGGYVDQLDILVSDYWFQNERNNLVQLMYQRLDIDNRFQLGSCSTHCKLTLIETHSNRKYVFHGSANMRSYSNIEQIMFEESEDLYNFNLEIQNSILNTYFSINKSVRRNKLWQAVQTVVEEKQDFQHGEKDVHLQGEQTESQSKVKQKWEHHSKPERIKIERFKF